MPRATKEWIGKTDDEAVPPRVKLRIWRRQCGNKNFAICPLSSTILTADKKGDLDHDVALIDNGQHRESNLRYVHPGAHKEKTREEVGRRASNDAKAKRHLGLKSAPTSLSGPTHEELRDRKDRRSKQRQGDGKLPQPAQTRDIFGAPL